MKTLAIVGNPNCGKTVIFNKLTGARQKVANYPGVTVEKISGKIKFLSKNEKVVDLPGIYSMNKNSEDARIATEILQTTGIKQKKPALKLTQKSGEEKIINKYPFPEKNTTDDSFSPSPKDVSLENEITHLLIIMDSTSLHKGLNLTIQAINLKIPTIVVLNMKDELIARGGKINKELLSEKLGISVFSISATKGWGINNLMRAIKNHQETFKVSYNLEELQTLEEVSSYSEKLADETLIKAISSHKLTDKLDAVFLHRLLGPISFLIIFILLFQSIFTWAVPIMDLVDSFFGWVGSVVNHNLADGMFKDLLIEGVIGGVGSVLIFLPQIIVLFTFIGFLEFSGYMPRASFVMDRIMNKFGLQGKSFLPLISSYACAIPAIMATRTIESKRERLITMFISPLGTCSARLPVYVLLISAFVEDVSYFGGLVSLRTIVMISLYLLGLISALGTAFVLKKVFGHVESTPYIQDIPPYRFPSFKSMYMFIFHRALSFIKRAGKVVFMVTVILWVLASFPREDVTQHGAQASYAGQIGKTIEPLIKPLGFDWKIGVGLITSLAAREVIISTLATINEIEDGDDRKLIDMFRQTMTLPVATSLIVFFVFALQCLATIATARRETTSWKIPTAMFFYMLTLAYVFSFITYNVTTFFFS